MKEIGDNRIEKILPDLEKDISDHVKGKLHAACFHSQLKSLISRIQIPISEEEMSLIKTFRTMRNQSIHGKGMREATDLNVKKMIGIVSRIITYKLQDVVKERES